MLDSSARHRAALAPRRFAASRVTLVTPSRALAIVVLLAAHAGAQAPVRPPSAAPGPPPAVDRITVLTDAFGGSEALAQDWGYAALIEYGGARILFDTGNNAERFAANVRALGVDLTRLDAVVISHRHGDHTDGLRHLLAANPGVRIYVPDDEYFGGGTPAAFFRQTEPTLPPEMRYFRGAVPDSVPHGSAWRGNFVRVGSTRELLPGISLVRNISAGPQFVETPELSLVIATPTGPIVVVGCSHPGIERILASVPPTAPTASPPVDGAAGPRVRMIVGGLHLVTMPPADVDSLVTRLRQRWGVVAIAPGHCTGEHAFARLRRAFGRQYVYAGVGTVIPLS